MELGITGLKKIYGTRQVLSIPRLTVSSGLITAVAGANGAGKTTLLNLLAGWSEKTEERSCMTVGKSRRSQR